MTMVNQKSRFLTADKEERMGRKGYYQVETWWRDEVPDERKLWESKKMYSWPEVVQYMDDMMTQGLAVHAQFFENLRG